jgi:hypothetical protein
MTDTINYSKEIHNIINSANKIVIDTNKEKYNLILNFLNDLIKPEKQYFKITQFKNINEQLLIISDNNTQIINNYIIKFNENGFKLNIKNKNPLYIIKHICNKIGYSFIKKKINDICYYSIIYKSS